MTQDEITKRAVAESSPLTGWHPYPVFCGRYLIASMPTQRMQSEFIAQRGAAYPSRQYGPLPVR